MKFGIGVLIVVMLPASLARAADYELKWDNGAPGGYSYGANAGEGFWYANDFDVSTLGGRFVRGLKIMGYGGMMGGWDGFRIALFSFGGTPGSIIWPTSGVPKFVKGSGVGYVWCEFDVGWTLPAGNDKFVAGQEQYYLPPNCDPFWFDDNENQFHTWHKPVNGPWYLFTGGPIHNLMLRVLLEDEAGVAPASLGRVKALFR